MSIGPRLPLVDPGDDTSGAAPYLSGETSLRSRALGSSTKIWCVVLILAAIVLVAVLGPWITPYDPVDQSIRDRLQGPSSQHWLGTDELGRDTLSRLISGARVTMIAAMQGSLVAVLVGLPPGLLAGYNGKSIDAVFSLLAETLLAVPPLILALAVIGVAGPGLSNAMIAVGVSLAPQFFRIARNSAAAVRTEPYIEAGRSIGCSKTRLALYHLLPNASGPLLVQASFTVGFVISAEASLSFLGLGAQPPQSSWGRMLNSAFEYVHISSFGVVPPAVILVITVFSLFTLGDALRDALGRQVKEGG